MFNKQWRIASMQTKGYPLHNEGNYDKPPWRDTAAQQKAVYRHWRIDKNYDNDMNNADQHWMGLL